jgi:hypothetical protein
VKLTKSREKENINKAREVEGEKRKKRGPRKIAREIVDNQSASHTAKPLKEGKQK